MNTYGCLNSVPPVYDDRGNRVHQDTLGVTLADLLFGQMMVEFFKTKLGTGEYACALDPAVIEAEVKSVAALARAIIRAAQHESTT